MEFEAFKSSLIEKLEMINVKIDEHQAKQFYDYMNLLIEWNEKINLTAITKPEEIMSETSKYIGGCHREQIHCMSL